MSYDRKNISKLGDTVEVFQIYEEWGHGVMEAPYYAGKTVKTLECTEFDAFILSEGMNIEKHGSIHKRSFWESPMFRYKKVKID